MIKKAFPFLYRASSNYVKAHYSTYGVFGDLNDREIHLLCSRELVAVCLVSVPAGQARAVAY